MNEAINFRAKKLKLYDAIFWICSNLSAKSDTIERTVKENDERKTGEEERTYKREEEKERNDKAIYM